MTLPDETRLIAAVAEAGEDAERVAALCREAVPAFAPLARKAAWALARAREGMPELGDPPSGFASDFVRSWLRFFVHAAEASRGRRLALPIGIRRRHLYVAWHFPEYPLLMPNLVGTGAAVLVAQRARWMEVATPGVARIDFLSSPHAVKPRFARGDPIVAMLDYCYDATSAVVAPFLGHPARTPAGLLAYTARFGYDLTVVSVRPDRSAAATQLDIGDAGPRELAERVNRAIAQEIRLAPARWLLWPSVDRRWAVPTRPDAPVAR
jgi:hypothetical protein